MNDINNIVGDENIDIKNGDLFGNWTVIQEDFDKSKYKGNGRRYLCKCSCGNIKSVSKSSLVNEKSKSCGCYLNRTYNAPKDLVGNRYGKLTVVENLFNYNNRGRTSYRCKCDCGSEIIVTANDIKKVKSCGCYRYDKSLKNIGKKYGLLTITNILFTNCGTMAECSCDCGNKTVVRLDQIKTGNTRSCGCLVTPNLVGMKFGRLTVLEETKSNTKQRKWLCLCDCGCKTILTTHLLKSGHTQSCGCIRSEKVSTWEMFISDVLRSLNIEFEKEKVFDGCKDIKALRFDFYLPKYNMCIEYDGDQHFKPISYFGGDSSHKQSVRHDIIKNEYCKEHGIRLIRISSKSKERIQKILTDIIQNPVTTTVA